MSPGNGPAVEVCAVSLLVYVDSDVRDEGKVDVPANVEVGMLVPGGCTDDSEPQPWVESTTANMVLPAQSLQACPKTLFHPCVMLYDGAAFPGTPTLDGSDERSRTHTCENRFLVGSNAE